MNYYAIKSLIWNVVTVSFITALLLLYFYNENLVSNTIVILIFVIVIPLIIGLCGACVFVGKLYIRLLLSIVPLIVAPLLYKSQASGYLPDAEASSLLFLYITYWIIVATIVLFLSEYIKKAIFKKKPIEN